MGFRNLIVYGLFCVSISAIADSQSNAQYDASFVFQRITGKPLNKKHPKYQQFLQLAQTGNLKEIARIASDEPSFVAATVRQWGSLYLSSGKVPNLALNDALATLIGSVRDNMDARLLLTGDYLYGADPRLGLGQPVVSSNTLYERIEEQKKDLKSLLFKHSPQWNVASIDIAAGLLTTRGWAEKNYSAGTNRRAVQDAFEVFLCKPIAFWKTPFLPPFRIRQDIDRAPSGDASTFQKECRSCHAPMDALAGAFSRVDFKSGGFVTSREPVAKYFQHPEMYPEGYVTTDDTWINFLTEGKNAVFGWNSDTEGTGLLAFGEMVARSSAFSACLATRVFQQVCGETLDMHDPFIRVVADDFEKNGYLLKDLFIDIVTRKKCRGVQEKIQAIRQGGFDESFRQMVGTDRDRDNSCPVAGERN